MAEAKRAVLIVEDESIVAHDLQQTLASLGYDAFAIAASAEEAMARAGERRPDLALVDIRIKGRLDGIKTAQLLRQRFGIPIVFLTAHADDATVDKALKTRPHGFLLKPIKVPELRSAIESALYRSADEGRANGSGALPSVASPGPAARGLPPPKTRARRQALELVLKSPDFDAPRRSREFLRFIAEETLAGRGAAISQTTIARQVFGRKDDFDAIVDPIVRIQAGRLRRSLERYYLLSGLQDPVRIELPRGTYVPHFSSVNVIEAVATEGGTQPASTPERNAPEAEPSDGWPSLVLTGFEVASPSAEVHELAVRAGEELALELGRYGAVRVLRPGEAEGRQPALVTHARFTLAGRLREEGDGLRFSARLVDRATGGQVWADEYPTASRSGDWTGSLGDAARVIAARVGGDAGVVVQHLAAERRNGKSAEPTPYDALLLSYEFFLTRDPNALLSAVEALRRVVAAQPDCGPAWTRLARLYLTNYTFEITPNPAPIDEAITFAQQGLRADPASRPASCMLASALLIKGELAAARQEVEEALRSSAHSLVYLETVGCLLTLLGDWERGPALSRSARERNPHCLPHVLLGLWVDGLRRGDFEAAYQFALEYKDPSFLWRPMMRAASLGLLGRAAEAKAEVAHLLSRKPDFPARGRTLIGHYIKFDEVMNPIVRGLARAGLELA